MKVRTPLRRNDDDRGGRLHADLERLMGNDRAGWGDPTFVAVNGNARLARLGGAV